MRSIRPPAFLDMSTRRWSLTSRWQVWAIVALLFVSTIVLAWLKEPEYATTFFCKRDAATGESKICSLPQVPHFTDLVKKQPISDLFAEGWLEAAL